MKHLYYALGGGLGHFTRSISVLEALQIEGEIDLLVSPHLKDWSLPFPGNITLKLLPETCIHSGEKTLQWVESFLSTGYYDHFWLDAFPLGLFAEMKKCSLDIRCHYIARILKTAQWMKHDFPIRFSDTYLVEEIAPEHKEFIDRHSDNVLALDLAATQIKPNAIAASPYWLLTHSGNQEEVDRLIELSIDAPRVIAAVRRDIRLPIAYERVTTPPPYYHYADRIISGCGFNTMLETRFYRDKHCFLPFPRRFDDQFLRASMINKLNHG